MFLYDFCIDDCGMGVRLWVLGHPSICLSYWMQTRAITSIRIFCYRLRVPHFFICYDDLGIVCVTRSIGV